MELQNEIPLHTYYNSSNSNSEHTKCWQGWVAKELALVAGRDVKWYSQPPWKRGFLINNESLTIWSSNPTPWHLPKWVKILCTHRNLHVTVYSSFIPFVQTSESSNLNQEGKVHSYHIWAICFKRQWNLGLPLLLKCHSALCPTNWI